jgi:glucan biosynthesis protein C
MSETLTPPPMTTLRAPVRRHDLDWLRVIAVFGLIPFHVAIIFTAGAGDYVKNSQKSAVLGVLAGFVTFWGIPLLFVVSGASAWFALATRTRRQYLAERFKRLVIPFVFGVLLIVPVQVYYGRRSDPGFHQSYLEFYPRFLAAFSLPKAAVYWAHLWFIPCLLAFAVITLPLFWYLRRPAVRRFIAGIGRFSEMPGGILLLGLPMGMSETVLRAKPTATFITTYLTVSNWAEFGLFLLCFIVGYVLYADAGFERAIRRQGFVALLLGLVVWGALRLVVLFQLVPNNDYSLAYVLYMLTRGFVSWFFLVAILNLGMRYLTFTNRLLEHLEEAFYPVYVLHMPVLTIIGFYVVQWQAGIWVKFAVIVVATLVVTLGVYEVLIRWSNVVRFLFGLKPRKPRQP